MRIRGAKIQEERPIRVLFNERPDVVWLQLPPTFLMHLLLLFRVLVRRRMKVVADCHNAALRAPWSVIPLSRRLLNWANLVLVHNHDIVPAARDLGVDPRDPIQNLSGGARYLRQQLNRFNGDVEKALAAYNAGPGRVTLAGGIPSIPETQAYVRAIVGRLASNTVK